jgi:hypothetical protein
MSAINVVAVTTRRRLGYTPRHPSSPIAQAAQIACDVADVLTRLNETDIPDLDAAAIHLREAARLVNHHASAVAPASQRYRCTVRDIARRLQELL